MSTVTGTTATTTATSTTTTAKQPGILNKDDFLKLLVGQMKNQDPMDPKANMDIGQMAQMSMMEQITNMAASTQSLLDQTRASSALGLVGRTVTYADGDGNPVSGVVKHVTMSGGAPSLTIDNVDGVSPDAISEVS